MIPICNNSKKLPSKKQSWRRDTSFHFNVRIKNDLYAQLISAAQEMGVSRGELVTQAIREMLERNHKK
jgi:predicted HicB family RNase H-like nuclease